MSSEFHLFYHFVPSFASHFLLDFEDFQKNQETLSDEEKMDMQGKLDVHIYTPPVLAFPTAGR